jgi:hypothetical protein
VKVMGAGRGKPGVYPMLPGILIKIKIETKKEIYQMFRGLFNDGFSIETLRRQVVG